MRKSIECRLKRSALVAAVLAAFLFAAGCGGGVDDPKKKINEGQDKTGTGQTDSSGSGEQQQQQQSQEPSEGPGGGQTPQTQTPSTPPVETEEVEVQVISITADTADYAKVDGYAASDGKKLKVNLTKGGTDDARFGEAKSQLETKLESAVSGAVKLFKDDGASAEADKTNLTAKKFYFGKEITEKEVTLKIETINAASDDGLCDNVASGYGSGDNKTVKVKISKAAYNNSDTKVTAEAILMKLPAALKALSDINKDCLVYKEAAGKSQLTNKDTDQLKKDGTGKIYFGTRNNATAVKVKFTIQSISQDLTAGGSLTNSYKKVEVSDLTGTDEKKLGELFGREVAEAKVPDEIKAVLKAHIVANPDSDIADAQNKFRLFKKAAPTADADKVDLADFAKKEYVGETVFVGIRTNS